MAVPNMNKFTNVALSSSKTFYQDTVNSTFYNTQKIQNKQNNETGNNMDVMMTKERLKKDLRKEHFKLGSD